MFRVAAHMGTGVRILNQLIVRYYGLYTNAHRGKVKKASLSPSALRLVDEAPKRIPSEGWAN